MKKHWVLKQDFKKLRDNMKLSMADLAESCYSTNTTIFRIEKTGIVFDELLAKKLSESFCIPFEELFEEKSHEDESLDKWNEHLKDVYRNLPDMNQTYYLVFVIKYDGGKNYRAISPTYWLSKSGDSFERRKIIKYYPDYILEHLAKFNMKCAVIHNEMDLIYFYYGLEDENYTAILICTDTIKEFYLQLQTEYFVKQKDLLDFCGFKDCVSIQLRISKNFKKTMDQIEEDIEKKNNSSV